MRYTVGARVRVQVSRVDLDGRKIDFRMVHEGDEGGIPARPRKVVDKTGGAAAELASVKGADRAAKAGTKAAKGRSAHPVRAAKTAARKSGGKPPAKAPRRR